jgi:hypothetical protein
VTHGNLLVQEAVMTDEELLVQEKEIARERIHQQFAGRLELVSSPLSYKHTLSLSLSHTHTSLCLSLTHTHIISD